MSNNLAGLPVRMVSGDGVDLAVQERGDTGRPTVLLVHGYPDTQAVWEPVAALLAGRYRVVTYDVRGAGASSRPRGTEPYRFEHLMNDMRAVLDAVSPDEPVHLVGHDWGSIQSWEAVTTMADRFASYTSISGPCLDHVAHWARSSAGRVQRLRQTVHSWYIGFFQLPLLPELLWRSGLGGRVLALTEGLSAAGGGHPAPTMKSDAAAGVGLYRANFPDRLRAPRERRTTVPTQVVIPAKDRYVTPALAEGAPRPFATDLRIRHVQARHWVPVTHPDLVAGLIEEHIERVGGAGGTA
jgi:pimeloyl-ACP methyl ester carboxylesterase